MQPDSNKKVSGETGPIHDDDLHALSKHIVREIKSLSNWLLNRSDKVVSLLHYAQKYDVNLSSLENPAITPKGLFTRLIDENWWLRRLRKAYALKLEQHARDIWFSTSAQRLLCQ